MADLLDGTALFHVVPHLPASQPRLVVRSRNLTSSAIQPPMKILETLRKLKKELSHSFPALQLPGVLGGVGLLG